jgi:SHAQKYF class myb-like DNA-binding protein
MTRDPNPIMVLGRWSDEEHYKFLEALRIYGKDWDKIQAHIGTRDAAHCRSHAQKFLIKLEKSMNAKSPKKMIEDAQIYHDILSKRVEKPNRKFRFLEHFDKLWNEQLTDPGDPVPQVQLSNCNLYLTEKGWMRIIPGQPIFTVTKDE